MLALVMMIGLVQTSECPSPEVSQIDLCADQLRQLAERIKTVSTNDLGDLLPVIFGLEALTSVQVYDSMAGPRSATSS